MKKYIIPSVIVILAIMFVPLFWLKLAQWAFGGDIETKDLIITAIGLVGAILGGVISGGMTLMGVKSTIKHENDIRIKDQIPQKIELIRKSKYVIGKLVDVYNNQPIYNCERFESNKEKLYHEASNIDHECYNQLLLIEKITVEYKESRPSIERNVNSEGDTIITINSGSADIFRRYKQELENYNKTLEEKMLYYQEKIS